MVTHGFSRSLPADPWLGIILGAAPAHPALSSALPPAPPAGGGAHSARPARPRFPPRGRLETARAPRPRVGATEGTRGKESRLRGRAFRPSNLTAEFISVGCRSKEKTVLGEIPLWRRPAAREMDSWGTLLVGEVMLLQHANYGDLSSSKNKSLCLSVPGRGSCLSTGSWLEGTVYSCNKHILSFAGAGSGIMNLSSTDRVQPHLQSVN